MKDFEQENIIDKWLEKNGTNEIKKQVENEYKIMKLVSMTDKVLDLEKECQFRDDCEFAYSVRAYANFLKLPLELGMFVPCDENGKVFKEPKEKDYFDYGFNLEFNQKHFKEVVMVEYNKAKENFIFDGIKYAELKKDTITIEYIDGWLYEFHIGNTIEDLLTEIDNLVINQNAIKKYNL